jgi:hypothetical protein
MKILISKNQYGISAIVNNGNTENPAKCFIDVWTPEEKAKTLKTNTRYYIKVTDGSLSCYKKKDGSIAPKLMVKDFEVIKSYQNDYSTPTATARPITKPVEKPVVKQPEPALPDVVPIDDETLPF